jgi:hypothetical protein
MLLLASRPVEAERPAAMGPPALAQSAGTERPAVSLAQLVADLDEVASSLEADPDVRAHWDRLVTSHTLADTPVAYQEFVRVRLVHEAFRSGGWAGLQWAITDQEPDSTQIWAAWLREEVAPVQAECDELSAVFAFMARRLGVDHVGLFWPTWNHTVAVWTTPGASGRPVRIVVPTSQIFLEPGAGLGDRGFDPRTQRTIYDYGARDLVPSTVLPEALVTRILEGARRYGGASEAELVAARLAGGWSPG